MQLQSVQVETFKSACLCQLSDVVELVNDYHMKTTDANKNKKELAARLMNQREEMHKVRQRPLLYDTIKRNELHGEDFQY